MPRALAKRDARLQKLVAAAGGFMVLAGILILGVAVLATSGFLSIGLLLGGKYVLTLSVLMILIGFFDVFVAFIVARW